MVSAQERTQSLEPEAYWSKDEDDEYHGNSRALNTIFNGVSKKISSYQHMHLNQRGVRESQNYS